THWGQCQSQGDSGASCTGSRRCAGSFCGAGVRERPGAAEIFLEQPFAVKEGQTDKSHTLESSCCDPNPLQLFLLLPLRKVYPGSCPLILHLSPVSRSSLRTNFIKRLVYLGPRSSALCGAERSRVSSTQP
ncbi:peroxisomal, testis specific 1, partial [Mus musculus]